MAVIYCPGFNHYYCPKWASAVLTIARTVQVAGFLPFWPEWFSVASAFCSDRCAFPLFRDTLFNKEFIIVPAKRNEDRRTHIFEQ